MFVYQEKEKDEEFISQLQKEIESFEEQLNKLELEVCNLITFCYKYIYMYTHTN